MRIAIAIMLLAAGCQDNLTLVDRDDYQAPEVAPLACVPNLDGRIDRGELAAAIGVPIRYLVSPAGATREIDVTGGEDGWDLSIDYADDQQVTVVPALASERWYGEHFPPDAFVTPYDAGGRIEAIASLDDEALWLRGLASREPDPPEGRTLVIYDAPLATLRFPVAPGQRFSSSGSIVDGVLLGLPYAGVDSYEIEVDAVGALALPQLSFSQVHRVRQRVVVQPAVGAATSQRRVSWFFECFAEVARAVSAPEESDPDFDQAAELWRLGLE